MSIPSNHLVCQFHDSILEDILSDEPCHSRIRNTPLGQDVLCKPTFLSLLLMAATSKSLAPGSQTALTHLLEASLNGLSLSALSTVTLPPPFDSASSVQDCVIDILLLRLADCLVPNCEVFRGDKQTVRDDKRKQGPDTTLDHDEDHVERSLTSIEEATVEGGAGSQSVDGTLSTTPESATEGASGEERQSETPQAANGTSQEQPVDNVELEKRLALFLHKREDESPHEV